MSIEWIGIGVTGLLGIAGLVFAARANGAAKKANKLAEASNRIAASAIDRADRANKISESANELSEDANSLVRRSVSQQEEDWFVEWEVRWDEDAAAIVIVNRGRDAARQCTVTVAGDYVHRTERFDEDVSPGAQLQVAFPELPEERTAFNLEGSRTWERHARNGIFGTPATFEAAVKVTVIWKTALGVPQQQAIDLLLT